MVIAFGASLGTAVGTSPDNSWDITTTATVPAGGQVVVGVGWFNASTTLTVSGGGLTWTTHVTQASASRNVAVATAPAPAGLASGSTITVTTAAGSFACGSAAMYVTGADTLDATGVGGGSTVGWSASLTSLVADTVVVGFGWVDGLVTGTSTPAAGYTEWCDFRNDPDQNVFSGVYQIVSSAAGYTPGGTWSSGTFPWVAAGITLKASGAAPATGEYAAHWKQRPPGFLSPATARPTLRSAGGAAPVVADPPYFTAVGGSTPELIVSSEDWFLLCNATVNHAGNPGLTWDDYFTARQAQGYNAVEVTMFSYPDPSAITSSGQDSDGVWPFSGSSNNPTNAFNTTWTDRRDLFFSKAASYGFRVFCNITTPYLDLGAFTASWTNTQWTNWGTKIGTQWGSVTNVMWMVGDDYFGDLDSQLDLMLTAMRANGANQSISVQNHQEMTSRTDLFDGSAKTWGRANGAWDWVYTYNPPYDGIEKADADNATLTPIPYMWGDGFFLGSSTTGLTDKQLMRRMVWWTLSSGGKGVNLGHNTIYPWDTTASLTEVQTNTFFTSVMPAIASYFRSLPNWHLLRPDTSSQLVTAGRGTHVSPRVSGGSGGQYLTDTDAYVTASYIKSTSHAGELAVIYMSHGSTITIDESKMVAGYTATWVDPASGATSAATPGTTYNSTAKGTNSDGQNDWVLVLQPATTAFSASATVTETVSITASGVVATSASATVSETVTITAGSSATGQANRATTATATASGNVATTASATVAETVSLTASGAAAGQANVVETVTITASGTVTGGVSATVVETVTITASGLVATTASGTVTETVSVTAAGVVATSSSATVTETVTITAAGTVSGPGSATVVETVTITAAGVVATTATASVSETVTVTGSGTSSATATRTETVTITAAGLVSATATRTTTVTVTASGLVAASATAAVVTMVTISAAGFVLGDADPYPIDATLYERATVTVHEAATATIQEAATVTSRA